MTQTTGGEDLKLLVFELAGARYAMELASVREVVRAVFITPLPGAPAVVEGVLSVRGELVPVYDLRARFRLPARPLHPDDVIVMAWTGERRVGIRCERAERIVDVAPSAVQAAPAFRHGRDDRIAGVVSLDDGLVLIQDLPAFLDAAEKVALDAALDAAPDAARDAAPARGSKADGP
ncbi:MAG TPA: chemotaxis protein CheW [Longimicrobiales bacterium]|nr:chemotaxis protein CheW [Longimicrobiales bacterium]